MIQIYYYKLVRAILIDFTKWVKSNQYYLVDGNNQDVVGDYMESIKNNKKRS